MEVFGAVGTAITLIQMTKNSLGRARRVGQGIEGLRIILVELREIQDDVDPVRDRDLLAQIAQLVEEARELIEDNSTPTRLALKFLWTNSLDADVQRINTSLAAVCRRLERRARFAISISNAVGGICVSNETPSTEIKQKPSTNTRTAQHRPSMDLPSSSHFRSFPQPIRYPESESVALTRMIGLANAYGQSILTAGGHLQRRLIFLRHCKWYTRLHDSRLMM